MLQLARLGATRELLELRAPAAPICANNNNNKLSRKKRLPKTLAPISAIEALIACIQGPSECIKLPALNFSGELAMGILFIWRDSLLLASGQCHNARVVANSFAGLPGRFYQLHAQECGYKFDKCQTDGRSGGET